MLLIAAALLSLAAVPALTDVIPPGCTSNELGLIVARSPSAEHNGGTITYMVTVCNGPFPPACQVTDLEVWFCPPGADGAPDMGACIRLDCAQTVNPGECVTCEPILHTLAVNPGVTVATAKISLDGLVQSGDPSAYVHMEREVSVNVVTSCMEVTKTATPTVSKAGDVVTYDVCLANCGSNTLSNVTVVDSLLGDLSGSYDDELLPGEAECRSFTYVLQPEDGDSLVNIVTAEATDIVGLTVSDEAGAEVDLVHPDFVLTKTCSPDPTMVGDTMTWDVCVQNTGDVGLDIHVVDATIVPGLDETVVLAPGGSQCWTRSRVVDHGDEPSISNEVVATATLDPATDLPNVLTRTATAECEVAGHPCIEVTKTVEPLVSKAGDDVVYTIEVCSCGPLGPHDVTVVDSLLGDLSGSFVDVLSPGECDTQSFSYTVQVGDPDPLVNVVEVTGTDAVGVVATDDDDASVDLVHPDFTLTKDCYPDPTVVGDTMSWDVCVQNTGDVGLDIHVVDASLMPGLDETVVLAPGESQCWTRSRMVTWADPPAVSNVATAEATLVGVDLPNVLTREATATCDVEFSCCISVTKTPREQYAKAGDDVHYDIHIENCGSLPLTNIAVVDSLLGDLSGSFVDALAPGECDTATFPYVVQPDDPAPLVNVVSVTGADRLGYTVADEDDASVDLVHPDFSIVKQCSPDPVDVCDTITWTVTVTNTGDVTLVIAVSDPTAGIDETVTLPPGESHDITRSRTVTADDYEDISNLVTATATLDPAIGLPNQLVREAIDTCHLVCGPCIEVTKTAEPATAKCGDEVVYTIQVHNRGCSDLENIEVIDSLLEIPPGTFPVALATGEASEPLTFTRTVLPTDPNPLVNQVTATAQDASGYAVTDTASGTVEVTPCEGQPPTCNITYTPSAPGPSDPVAFNANASDPDGEVVAWEWSFGDGSADSGEIVTHSYGAAGTYTVTLTVTDDTDLSATCTDTIDIAETLQVAIPLSQGWHMISLPLEPINKTILVDRASGVEAPGSIFYTAWLAGNDPRMRLFRAEPGAGYWVYNPQLYPDYSWYEIGIDPPPGKPHPGPWWQGFWFLVQVPGGITLSYEAHALPGGPAVRFLDITGNYPPGTFAWAWMIIGACARMPDPYTPDVTTWPPTSTVNDLMWGASTPPSDPTAWLPTSDCVAPDAWHEGHIGLPMVGHVAGGGYYAVSPPQGEPLCGAPADTDMLRPGEGYWLDVEGPQSWLRLFPGQWP